jgi:hypothetical protein
VDLLKTAAVASSVTRRALIADNEYGDDVRLLYDQHQSRCEESEVSIMKFSVNSQEGNFDNGFRYI